MENMLKEVLNYKSFMFVGIAMSLLALTKLFGYADFSSDWFWFIAGIGLVFEGWIAFIRQKMFKQKYKIVLRKVDK